MKEKILNFIKSNYILILIIFLGFFLRFNYDLFIQGYNFDELAMVSIAGLKFPFEILKTSAIIDYHAPLYYLIIHFLTYFQNEWIYLRLLNLFFSIVNIFVFYKIGNLLKNKETGLILALILAIFHLNISTVSFIKFYCLCFLLFSINIYYLIKILKQNKGFIKFGIINFFFILSSTLGFICVGIEYFLILLFQKDENKDILKSVLISFLGFLLYLPILLKQTFCAFNNIISPHSAYVSFSGLSFYNFLNDYFSPFINYCCNQDTIQACSLILNVIVSIKNNSFDYLSLFGFVVFSLIPVTLGVGLIIFGIIKNKLNRKLFLVGFLILIFYITISKLDITGFIPFYLYSVGLILLICFGFSLSEIQNKKLKYGILFFFLFINLFITNFYPLEKRDIDKIKIYNCFNQYFKDEKISSKTPIFMTNGARFLKYYYKDKNIIDFDYEKMSALNSRFMFSLIFGKDLSKKASKFNIKTLIKPIIKNKKVDNALEIYVLNILKENNIKKGDKIILCFNSDSNPFISTQEKYLQILNKNQYNPHLSSSNIKYALSEEEIDASYMGEVISSYSYECLFNIIEKNFKIIDVKQYTNDIYGNYFKNFETKNFEKSGLYLAQNTLKSWIFITYEKL